MEWVVVKNKFQVFLVPNYRDLHYVLVDLVQAELGCFLTKLVDSGGKNFGH